MAALQGQGPGQRFHDAADLSAERAADIGADDPNIALRKLQSLGDLLTGQIKTLRIAPDRQLALGAKNCATQAWGSMGQC